MKSIRNSAAALFIFGGLVVSLLHAQAQTTQDSIVQITAESNGLSLVSPSDLPDAGTFWVVDTNGVLCPNPCPPPNAANLPIYGIADNEFLVDATGGQVSTDGQSVQDALAALADAVNNLINQVQASLAPQTMARAFGMSAEMDSPSDASPMLATFDTSGLYLQITNMANGLAYLSLMNGTDYVYEIYSKTDLTATNWNITGEVFPTDTNCMPFTVPALDQTNLFIWARDWTGITSNGNETPEWWFWKYFGTVNLSDTNLDSDGVNTLLYDYTNNIEPTNAISFTVRLGNQNFNSTSASGSYLVLGGIPSYEAVLVNDDNFSNAVWQPYDGNITMNLGLTDGVYQVWLGLKGFAADAQPTWVGTEVTLTRTAPELFLTSPTTNLVAQPYLQVQGFSALPLASVSYDVSNAVAVVTNQLGSIIEHFLDTNTSSYTTDFFQCYDILLTNGLNTITLHATDPAGNMTTTNLNVMLDFATATNPVVQLTWPQPGMEICQNSFTLRGWTEDSSAAVVAQITDTNGNTNIVSGVVERTGVFWVENLPLNAGTNFVTLWVTNAAGFSSVTNFSVVQSSMTFNLTTIDGDLWSPTVNVSGIISDPTYSVSVNGVPGMNNGDGTWSATNVPVSAGGVASFDFKAVAPGGGDPDGSLNTNKVTGIRLETDTWNYTQMMDANTLHWKGNLDWNADKGGTEHDEFHPGDVDWNMNDYTIGKDGNFISVHYTASDGTDTNYAYGGQADMPLACGSLNGVGFLPLPLGGMLLWSSNTRSDNAKMMLHTGGKGLPGLSASKNIFQLSATATEELATPPYSRIIPFNQITVAGKTLGTDGYAYVALEDNTTVDVTPQAGAPYYTFTAYAGKHTLMHQTVCTATGNTNNARTTIGIGEQVAIYFDPDLTMTFPETPFWTVLGAGSVSPETGSGTTLTASLSPGAATVKVQVRDVSIPTTFSVIAPSSLTVISHEDSPQEDEDPNGTQMGAGTYYTDEIEPTIVSFYNVSFRENPTPSMTLTWPNGTNSTLVFDESTNAWGVTCGNDTVQDLIRMPLVTTSHIFNGTNYVDFSFSRPPWADQYEDNNGNWVGFFTLTASFEFRGGDKKCRVIYCGVPGGWQGPY